jgi:hypothetical protein
MSAGWSLPYLADLTVSQTIDHVERAHRRRTGEPLEVVSRDLSRTGAAGSQDCPLPLIQEALTMRGDTLAAGTCGWRSPGGQ